MNITKFDPFRSLIAIKLFRVIKCVNIIDETVYFFSLYQQIYQELITLIGSPPRKFKETPPTLIITCILPKKLGVVDNLLLDHVELPNVLDLAVHLVNLVGWMGKRDHSKTILLLEVFYWSLLHG